MRRARAARRPPARRGRHDPPPAAAAVEGRRAASGRGRPGPGGRGGHRRRPGGDARAGRLPSRARRRGARLLHGRRGRPAARARPPRRDHGPPRHRRRDRGGARAAAAGLGRHPRAGGQRSLVTPAARDRPPRPARLGRDRGDAGAGRGRADLRQPARRPPAAPRELGGRPTDRVADPQPGERPHVVAILGRPAQLRRPTGATPRGGAPGGARRAVGGRVSGALARVVGARADRPRGCGARARRGRPAARGPCRGRARSRAPRSRDRRQRRRGAAGARARPRAAPAHVAARIAGASARRGGLARRGERWSRGRSTRGSLRRSHCDHRHAEPDPRRHAAPRPCRAARAPRDAGPRTAGGDRRPGGADRAREGGPVRPGATVRRLPVRRPDRDGEDGAGPRARRRAVRLARADGPDRHERAEGPGQRRAHHRHRRHARRRVARIADPVAAVLGRAAGRVREGRTAALGSVPAGLRCGAPVGPLRPDRRLPPDHRHRHVQPRLGDRDASGARLQRGRYELVLERAGGAGRARRPPPRADQPLRPRHRLPAARADGHARDRPQGGAGRARPPGPGRSRLGDRDRRVGRRLPAR